MFIWKTAKIIKLFKDLDADIKKKHVWGSNSDYRTNAIKIEPYGGTKEVVLIGYNSSEKNLDESESEVEYIEIRPDSETEEVKITVALIENRFKKLNIPYKIEDKWVNYTTNTWNKKTGYH